MDSTIILGVQSGADRNTASNYSICKNKKIKSIEDVTVDGTAYKAVYIDNGGITFDTEAGRTYLSTMPYHSGWNDNVLGTDGSRYNYTNGKEPGLLQKIEFQNGAYLIISDELWQWGKNENGDYTFDCYTCHDQTKVTTNGSISANYTKQTDLTLVFPSTESTSGHWAYIEDTAISNDPAVLWPLKVSTAAGSGTGVKAALRVNPAASGVLAAWVFASLLSGGYCGFACRISNDSVGNSHWNGAPGAPGLAG